MVTWIVSWQTFRWCALSGLTITPYKQVPPQLYEMATSTIIVTYPLCVIQNITLGASPEIFTSIAQDLV